MISLTSGLNAPPASDSADFFTAFLTLAFFREVFFATAGTAFFAAAFAASAFFVAQRFLSAATIAAFPALLSFRLGCLDTGVAGAGGSVSPRILAHRRC